MKWFWLVFSLSLHVSGICQLSTAYPFKEIKYDGGQAMHPAFASDANRLYFDAVALDQSFVFSANVAIDSFALVINNIPGSMPAPLMNGALGVLTSIGKDSKMLIINGKKTVDLLNKRKVEMRYPAFNSANNLIVFSGRQENDKYFALMSYDFRYDNLNRLIAEERDIFYPRWSPRSSFISYDTKTTNDQPAIGIMRWDRSPYTQIASDTMQLYHASWGASERRLVCIGRNLNGYYLLLMNLSGEIHKLLAMSNKTFVYPVWSADGRFVAVIMKEEKTVHKLLLFDLAEDLY